MSGAVSRPNVLNDERRWTLYMRGEEAALNLRPSQIARALHGDRDALEGVLSVADQLLRDIVSANVPAADVDCAVQYTLLYIERNLQEFDRSRDFGNWVAGYAWNAIKKYRERGWDFRTATNKEIPCPLDSLVIDDSHVDPEIEALEEMFWDAIRSDPKVFFTLDALGHSANWTEFARLIGYSRGTRAKEYAEGRLRGQVDGLLGKHGGLKYVARRLREYYGQI